MTFFNTNSDNKVKLRLDSIMANDVYQFNVGTGQYERVAGGGHTQLPYYLKTTDIEMNNAETNTGTVLNDSSLIIGNSSGNEILDKNKVKILSQLKTNIVDFVPGFYQAIFPVGYNNTTSNFERLSRLTIGTYNQYSDVSQTGLSSVNGTNMVQMYPTGLNIKSPIGEHFLTANAFKGLKQIIDNVAAPSIGSTFTGKFLVSYNKNTDTFERPNNFSLGTSTIYSYFDNLSVKVADGNFYTNVTSQGLTVKYNSTTAFFNYEDVKTCNKLYNPPLITPTANSKLIVIDPTTRVYNTINIPESSTLPSYLLANSIEMATGQSLKSSFGTGLGNTYIDLTNGKLTSKESNKTPILIDYVKFRNMKKRSQYALNSVSDWVLVPKSSITGTFGNFTLPMANKVPTFDLDVIGDTAIISMTNYTTSSNGDEGFVFNCPYIERVSNPRFEFEHLSSTGNIATFGFPINLTMTNGGRTRKGYFIRVTNTVVLDGLIRITVVESLGSSYDDTSTNIMNSTII